MGFLTSKRGTQMNILKHITKAQVLGVVRHALTVVGGIAINRGWIDSESAVQLTGWAVTGAAVIWSILSKPTKDQQ